MDFSAEVYKEAAREHIPIASLLYDGRRFVLANYVAGLSVESMLRAYRFKIDPVFDARHDLFELYRISKFEDVVPVRRVAEYAGLIGLVAAQWSNSHRYRSEKALRALFKRAKLDRGVSKGDFLKELTRRMVDAATRIVTLGVDRWQP